VEKVASRSLRSSPRDGNPYSFSLLKFTFLDQHPSIEFAAKLYPVHGLSGGIQSKNMFIRFTDVFYSVDFGLADSSYAVF
jgi:hypothetical protein